MGTESRFAFVPLEPGKVVLTMVGVNKEKAYLDGVVLCQKRRQLEESGTLTEAHHIQRKPRHQQSSSSPRDPSR